MGNATVDAAFRNAGLMGTESKLTARTINRKFNVLRLLDPSIELPQKTRDAVKAAGGPASYLSPVASPTVSAPASLTKLFSSARPVAPAAKPADSNANLHGMERIMAGIRREKATGTFGLPPTANEAGAWSLSPSLASIPAVGHTIERLDVEQLGALCCEVLGEVETNRLVARSNSDVETVHILERQMFIENLHIPGQKDDSFDPNLRMTNTTTGLAGVSHRRQQCRIDAYLAHLEESNQNL